MADNIIRVSVQPTKRQSVNITAGQVQTPISATADTSLYYSNLSKNWAIGEGLIQGEDYSSKHYANKSKASAQVAENFEASIRDSYNNFVTDATDYINELTELKETSAEEITMATTDGLLDIRNAKEEAVLSVETTKNDVIADITTVQNSAISNVEKEAKEQLQNIESTGFYMRDDKLYFINSKGEEEEFQSGGAGLQMFDTILKDHILTYEESKGLALQGTYVYKEAIAGSRYGYADFYNKCLEEYENAEALPWEQPKITSNGVMGGDSFAVEASSSETTVGRPAYKSFDGNSSTKWGMNSTTEGWLTFYNPKPLKVNSIVYNPSTDYPAEDGGNLEVLGCDDNSSWVSIWKGSYIGGTTTTLNVQSPNFYKYYRIAITNGTSKWAGLGDLTINAVVEGFKRNSNGHVFYDISLKDEIDELFNSTGSAWMYGIDTENERIFLPRDNEKIHGTLVKSYVNGTSWYRIYSDGWCEQGGVIGAGTSGTVSVKVTLVIPYKDSNYNIQAIPAMGNWKNEWGFGYNSRTAKSFVLFGRYILGGNFSWRTSGYVAEEYVGEQGIKNPKNCYICVGNTETVSSVTDVIEVTTTENDTIPLGYSTYQNGTQPSISWLKSEGQWNDGNVYTTFYNEFVNKLGQDFASGKVVNHTETFTDYDLVINQDEMTFRLPLLDGSECLPSDRFENLTINASDSTYIAPANGYFWAYGLLNASKGAPAYLTVLSDSGDVIADGEQNFTDASSHFWVKVAVKKGQTVKFGYTATVDKFRFIYAQGNGSLYFKVANAVQNLELLDAGEVLEAVNNVVPNNSSLIAGYGMPSNKNVDLTLGATGTEYTAPANGYLILGKTSNGAGQYMQVSNLSVNMAGQSVAQANGQGLVASVPAKKGDTLRVTYNAGGVTSYFKFIYAEGDK